MDKERFVCRILLLAGLLLVSPAHAEIYRWVDENGKVHFSDEKPADSSADIVNPEIADPAAEPDIGEMRRRSYLESANDPKYTPDEPPAFTSRSGINAEQCRRARVDYGILDEPVPAYRTAAGELRAQWSNDNHQGDRNYIPDAQREAEKDAAWRRMNQYCEDAGDQTAFVDAWNDYVDDIYCSEHLVKLEHARSRRSRTPKSEVERMEAYLEANCS